MDTFQQLQASSIICRSAWGSLVSMNLTDKAVAMVLEDDMVELKNQLDSLGTLKKDLEVLNKEALEIIAANLKKIIDGGSKDI